MSKPYIVVAAGANYLSQQSKSYFYDTSVPQLKRHCKLFVSDTYKSYFNRPAVLGTIAVGVCSIVGIPFVAVGVITALVSARQEYKALLKNAKNIQFTLDAGVQGSNVDSLPAAAVPRDAFSELHTLSYNPQAGCFGNGAIVAFPPLNRPSLILVSTARLRSDVDVMQHRIENAALTAANAAHTTDINYAQTLGMLREITNAVQVNGTTLRTDRARFDAINNQIAYLRQLVGAQDDPALEPVVIAPPPAAPRSSIYETLPATGQAHDAPPAYDDVVQTDANIVTQI